MKKARGRELFDKYKKFISLGTLFYRLFPRDIRIVIMNRNSHKKGKLRMAQRYMLLKSLAKNVGNNVSIHDNVFLFHVENLSIGNNVSIHPMCYIQASGGIEIGNDVSIAHGVTLMTENHSYNEMNMPIKDQPIKKLPIVIEDDVWIGAKATILCGKTVKHGSVIGANAVVTKDVAEMNIVAGNPAKIIRLRGKC